MRHRKAGVKLNRNPSHRKAMFRNMVTSLLKYEKIQTTDAKARELSRWTDKVITLAKRGDLHARRQVLSIVREKKIVHELFNDASERFGNINGGYTRIIKLGTRPGDAAPVSIIELVSKRKKEEKKAEPEKIKDEKTETAKIEIEAVPEKEEPETIEVADETVEESPSEEVTEDTEADEVEEQKTSEEKDEEKK